MKIMFYINTISYGGAERVIVNLANHFYDNGYDVVFVTTYKRETEYKLRDNIQRHVLLDRENYKFLKKNLLCVKQLRKLLSTEKTDILVSFMAEPNFRAIFSSLGLKTKNLISIRNDPNREYPNVMFRFLAKFLYRLADCVVFQTKDAQSWFPNAIRKKSCIIPNQVNEQFFQIVPAECHRDIVTVGRLTDQKNQEMLIRAFSRIANRIDDNLIIYGDGQLRESLMKLVNDMSLSERVFLPGSISDVPNTVKSAKLFVLSSNYEGMPNALIEAMVLGLPCISTDCPCGGPRELFDEQKNGLLVKVGDECELAEKMLYLLKNESIRLEISNNAARAAMYFSSESIFAKWETFVKKVIL